MDQNITLRSNPHNTGLYLGNNRKHTKGRVKTAGRVQSVPIFKVTSGEHKGQLVGIKKAIKYDSEFVGYKYIYHG